MVTVGACVSTAAAAVAKARNPTAARKMLNEDKREKNLITPGFRRAPGTDSLASPAIWRATFQML